MMNWDFLLIWIKKGTVWLLKSNADHLSRSKVLYHPTVIQKRKDDIKMCLDAQARKARSQYDDAVKVLELNSDCEAEIIKKLQITLADTIPQNDIRIDMANIEVFDKLLVKHLSAFYKCRVQEDLKEKIKLPSKGNLSKVLQNEVDKSSNGPFLIKLCDDVKSLPVIAKMPLLLTTGYLMMSLNHQ